MYKATYGRSYAIIIGINDYGNAPNLNCAVSDALAVAELLKEAFGFREEDMRVMLDQEASRSEILRAFLAFANNGSELDDRIFFFFAGHGHTEASWRGDVGYLVPADGRIDDLSTLLRWDDLTRNCDLVRAKHILFIMDACYSGLAISRALRPGSMRFLRDMLLRQSRQVLTAGMANEEVADSGGPVRDHSMFTGHLLLALQGAAKDNKGNLTANGVISYVYQQVSQDAYSRQTPHYGYINGDGDMIFSPSTIDAESGSEETSRQEMVSVPAITHEEGKRGRDDHEDLKRLLSDDGLRIDLHDHVVRRTRELLALTVDDDYFAYARVDLKALEARLHSYEKALSCVIPDQLLISRWGSKSQTAMLKLPIERLAQRIDVRGGNAAALELRWYPVLLLLYSSCFGSILAANYSVVRELCYLPVKSDSGVPNTNLLLVACFKALGQLYDFFKALQGDHSAIAPRSTYLLNFFQPVVDDIYFLGAGYENTFDRLEALLACEFAHIESPNPLPNGQEVWVPLGRHSRHVMWRGESVLGRLKAEAVSEKEKWQPAVGGLFGGSYKRFLDLAGGVEILLNRHAIRW